MLRPAVCAAVLVLAGACSSSTDKPAPSQHYRDGGIAVEYPDGWSAHERPHAKRAHSLIINSTRAALVIVDVKPPARALSLRAYADSFGALTRAATPIGKMGASSFGNIEHIDGFDVLVEHFTLTLLNVDVPHTRTYGRMTGPAGVCFLTAQTADNEKALVSPGFEEIFATFECGAPNAADPDSAADSALQHAH
jgi:hypothetical protein